MTATRLFALAALCAAIGAGCAQVPRQHESVATSASQSAMRDNRLPPAKLDAVWSSAVVGMAVQSASGSTLGRVQNVIVDGYGRPRFAILSYGGMAGLGLKYTAVPWTKVAEMLDRDKLVTDQSSLERAPVLANAGAEARSGEWGRDAERYWNAL